jgi:signal transduction histidine kinase
MREQVQHHLERARVAARVAVPGTLIAAAPVVTAVVRTMQKIYRERGLTIETRLAASVTFHGEQQDLEEMVGNLVDNACKWAKSRVDVQVSEAFRDGARLFFRVTVDDDGPGLPPEARDEVIRQRGKRLDESKPGSGLGLSIVSDLAALYAGRISLGEAALGGLRVELVLPAAEV